MIHGALCVTILLAVASNGLRPTQPLPAVRVELRVDDKSFQEMARIYSTAIKQQYRAMRLAATAARIARSFQAVHPFVVWTGNPDAPAQGVLIGTIGETDHAVSVQWAFYPKTGTGNIGAPCLVFSQFENDRHLQDLTQFGEALVKATSVCTTVAGLDLDSLSPFHASLRAALKNVEIAHGIDAIDDTHVYLPLEWNAFYPAPESVFRIDYWSDYQGHRIHGIAYLSSADRDSPDDTARVTTVPHVCDQHRITFEPIVKNSCGCRHDAFVNAAVAYKGLLQTMRTVDPAAPAAVYVDVYHEAHRSAMQGVVDNPDVPIARHSGGGK